MEKDFTISSWDWFVFVWIFRHAVCAMPMSALQDEFMRKIQTHSDPSVLGSDDVAPVVTDGTSVVTVDGLTSGMDGRPARLRV